MQTRDFKTKRIVLKPKSKIRKRRITLLLYKKWTEKGLLVEVQHINPMEFTARISHNNQLSKPQTFILL